MTPLTTDSADPSMARMSRRMTIVVALLGLPIAWNALMPAGMGGIRLSANIIDSQRLDVVGSQRWTTQRNRDYYRALQLCQERIDAGEEIVCPSPNDLRAIELLLKGAALRMADTTVLPPAPAPLSVDELNEADRALLRNYQNAGTCPSSLQDYTPGFYELCTTMLQHGGRGVYKGDLDARVRAKLPTQPSLSR